MPTKGLTPNKLVRARWSVMWVKGTRIIEKKFAEDLPAALRLYANAAKASKPGLTLRCTNMGQPPPDSVRLGTRIETRRIGKRRKRVRVKVKYDRMMELNSKGLYWCSYCCKLRRFREIKERREVVLQCPMCKITSRDFNIRQHNPKAVVISYHRRVRSARTRRRRGST